MRVDWRKASNSSVEAGVYEVRVKEFVSGISANQNPKLDVILEIIGPSTSPVVGRTIRDFLTITDAAIWRLAWFVNSCGIKIDALPDMDSGSAEFTHVLDLCVGRRLWVTAIVDSYQGKDRNKVTEYARVDDQDEITEVEEVPEFIKRRDKKGDSEEIPF